MAGGPNPLAMLAQLAQGGGHPGIPGGGDSGNPLGAMVAQQVAQMQQANPGMILQYLKQMKQVTAALIPHTADTIPGVAQALARNLGGIDKAIDAAQKAMMATQLAGGPIMNSAANPPTMNSGGF